MKKLMIAACAVALAVAAHAGTVSWSMTNIYDGNDQDKASGSLFLFNNATVAQTAVAAAITGAWTSYTTQGGATLTGADAVTAFLNEKALGADGTAYHYDNTTPGTFSTPTNAKPSNQDLGLTGDTTYTFYAVIFNDQIDDLTSDTKFFVSTTKDGQTKGDGSDASMSLAWIGTQSTASQDPANWNNVPEPTSGLLLLIGMAGLALKRKLA